MSQPEKKTPEKLSVKELVERGTKFQTELKMTRAEKRRQARGIHPCAGGCGKRLKLSRSAMGFCRECWGLLNPESQKKVQHMLLEARKESIDITKVRPETL